MTSKNIFRGLGYSLLATVVGALAVPAMAGITTLQADGSYSLNNTAPTVLQDAYPTDPVEVRQFLDAGLDSAGLHSYGSSSGFFGTRSSGGGTYNVSSSFHIAETIVNTSAYAQTATFNFTIAPGLIMNAIGSPLTGNDFVKSGLVFSVKRDGVSVFDSMGTLTTDIAGSHFESSGYDLYAPSGHSYYSINGTSLTINLGAIAAGASFTLSYDLSSFASGSSILSDAGFNPGGAFYVPDQFHDVPIPPPARGGPSTNVVVGDAGFVGHHIIDVLPTEIGPGVSQSFASTGDPFDIGFDGLPIYTGKGAGPSAAYIQMVRVVPEPATWALMLAGFGLTGMSLRRRKGLHTVSA